MNTTPEGWEERKKEILGTFNAGQWGLLTQNGSVNMSADDQRKEGEHNCRDAQIAVEATASFFLAELATTKEAEFEKGYMEGEKEIENRVKEAVEAERAALRAKIEEKRAVLPIPDDFDEETANATHTQIWKLAMERHNKDLEDILAALTPPEEVKEKQGEE